MYRKTISCPHLLLILSLIFSACNNGGKKPPAAEIVSSPEKIDESATDIIRRSLRFAEDNQGDIGDATTLWFPGLLRFVYEKNGFTPLWSSSEQWKPLADSMFRFINESRMYGLFPGDYHEAKLNLIRQRFLQDSLGRTDRRDAAQWSRADLMLTDAFMHIVHDLKLGRLPQDSITLRKDSVLDDDFYLQQLNILFKAGAVRKILRHLEPKHKEYHLLKAALPDFLAAMQDGPSTVVPSRKSDSLNFWPLLQKRLYETGYIGYDSIPADSVKLAAAVKRFQKDMGLYVDGKAGEATLRMLNLSDKDKFIRIAITLDKYKLLPEKMPARYLWVNIPSFMMRLLDEDSVKLVSKIICGKPVTRTPLLNSAISELITYPQWTIPASIIKKEILPAIKKDPGYLARKGFSLVDKNGEEVDPFSVDWTLYKQGIPYKVVQGSGDDNALGILKFNFPNKYAVYLHDTNQRHLFAQTVRSLSHGCVRVQEWEKLALYMIRRDAGDSTLTGSPPPMEDSLATWLYRKEKHSIPVRKRLPLFIRYQTCEAGDKTILFFDDIYGEDKRLAETFFAGK